MMCQTQNDSRKNWQFGQRYRFTNEYNREKRKKNGRKTENTFPELILKRCSVLVLIALLENEFFGFLGEMQPFGKYLKFGLFLWILSVQFHQIWNKFPSKSLSNKMFSSKNEFFCLFS